MSEFDGKVIIVTGGSTGLGFAMAKAFHAAGATVVITGRDRTRLEQAGNAIGPRASVRVHDASRMDDIPSLIADIEEEAGPIQCLVNNAGKHLKASVEEISDADFRAVLDINLDAAFAYSRECASAMAKRRTGSILMVSSMAALLGIPKVAAYSASKAGLLGLTRALATELGGAGIRVNAICPGFIDTPMFRTATDGDPDRKERILARTPLGQFGQPQDVADAALFLASPRARFVTGAVLPVDGGFSVGF